MDAPTFLQRLSRTIGLVTVVLVGLLFLWRVADIVLLAFAGLLVSILLSSITQKLSQVTRLPRTLSLVLVVVALLAFLVGAGFLIGPRLVQQSEGLTDSLTSSIRNLVSSLSSSRPGQWLLEQAPLLDSSGEASSESTAETPSDQSESPSQPTASSRGLLSAFVSVASRLFGFVPAVFGVLTNILFVVIFGIFLAANPKLYQRGLLQLFPQSKRERVQEVLNALGHTLRGWLLAQLVSMVVIGVLVALGLWWLGMPFVLSLAFIAFLLEFIPTVGSFLSAAPAVLIAFTQSPTMALWVLLFYLVVQTVEGNLLMPLIQQRVVHLPPALTLLTILIMGTLFGFLGLLVATPLLAVILVLVKMLYLEDTLGQKIQLAGNKSK
jgi:predicted PurR-regulated permease PerM